MLISSWQEMMIQDYSRHASCQNRVTLATMVLTLFQKVLAVSGAVGEQCRVRFRNAMLIITTDARERAVQDLGHGDAGRVARRHGVTPCDWTSRCGVPKSMAAACISAASSLHLFPVRARFRMNWAEAHGVEAARPTEAAGPWISEAA
jgi:hypothetical protein